jgi:hypothetical protein
MKRFLIIFLCIIICFSLSPTAFAADIRDLSFETYLASKLNELGLFAGVGNNKDGIPDFDLNRAPTRAEALVMLVRALGKDTEAKTYPKTHPFKDIPAWADGYVSYGYDNGLAKGISADKFGAGSSVSAEMYLSFLLRALDIQTAAGISRGIPHGHWQPGAGYFIRKWTDQIFSVPTRSILPAQRSRQIVRACK